MCVMYKGLGGGARVKDLWWSREEGASGGQEMLRRLEVWQFW